MRQLFIVVNILRLSSGKSAGMLFLIIGILAISRFGTFKVIEINKSIRTIPLSVSMLNSQTLFVPTPVPSPTIPSNTALSSSNSQDNGLISTAEFVIYWSGGILAFVTVLLALAGVIGFLELRSTRSLRKEVTKQVNVLLQQVTALKQRVESIEHEAEELEKHAEDQLAMLVKRFESDSQKLLDISYTFTEANIAYNLGNNQRAIDYFLRVLELQPDNLRVMERLGRAFSNLNKMTDATFYLNKALTIDPNNVPALRSLGLCYRYDNPTEAINKLQQVVNIDPSDFESWDFLGLIYRDQKQYDKAIAAHEHALKLERRPETEFYLSILYFLIGDTKKGKLMALNAENDLKEHDHQERIRPVWKILISAAVPIIDGNEHEAFSLIQSLQPYITSNRIHDGLKAHLEILLSVTNNKNWIPRFTKILQVKE